MITLQGWINGIDDIKKVKSITAELKSNYAIESHIMGMNGITTCSFFTCRNHLGKGVAELIYELTELSKNNLNLHGILYFNDDEDVEYSDVWQVWLFRKGVVEKTTDSYLSPISEKVENY